VSQWRNRVVARAQPDREADADQKSLSKNWAAEPLDSYPKILNFIRNTGIRG